MGMYPWPVPQPTPNPPTPPSVTPAPATPPAPKTGILPCTCKGTFDPGCAHHSTSRNWLSDVTAASKALTRSLASTWRQRVSVASTPSDAYGPQDVSRQPTSRRDIDAEIQRRCEVLRTWNWHPDPDLAGKRAFKVAIANLLELLTDERRWM